MRGFLIERDHIGAGREGRCVRFDGFAPEQVAELQQAIEENAVETVGFRAFDDDRELYFEGRVTLGETEEPGDEDEWLAFCWMQRDAGVTHLSLQSSFDRRKWELYP